jgi:hypothetical protein
MPSDTKTLDVHNKIAIQRLIQTPASLGTIFKIPKRSTNMTNWNSTGMVYTASRSTDAAVAYNDKIVLKTLSTIEIALSKKYPIPEINTRLTCKEILSDISEHGLKENFIYPLSDGGIAIEFNKNDIKYLIEIYNDNEDVLSKNEPNSPIKAWDLDHKTLLQMISYELRK